MPEINVGQRRKLEVEKAAAALSAELKEWQRAASAQEELETHHSQIEAACATLAALLDQLPGATPRQAAAILQSGFRIWDFYRAKFAQRLDARLSPFLNVADQLAYDCYSAVGKALEKAPPLVVLTGASQPYVQKRQSPFIVEGVATQEGLAEAALAATAQLPFPVIGLPWSQPSLLAGLTAIPPEVSHTVEDDLGLTPDLQSVFDTGNTRSSHWQRWQRELFADSWGALCCGPAFALGLADHLAPAKPWREPIDPHKVYPPAWLRIRYSFRLARALWNNAADWPAALTARITDWEAVYLEKEEDRPFLDDIDGIHSRLFALSLPPLGFFANLPLRFTPRQHRTASDLATQWLPPPSPPRLDVEKNMRVVVSAFRLAWDTDPVGVAARMAPSDVLREWMRPATHPGLRSAINVPAQTLQNRGKALSSWITGQLPEEVAEL